MCSKQTALLIMESPVLDQLKKDREILEKYKRCGDFEIALGYLDEEIEKITGEVSI
jgi:hypothetical protein